MQLRIEKKVLFCHGREKKIFYSTKTVPQYKKSSHFEQKKAPRHFHTQNKEKNILSTQGLLQLGSSEAIQ